MSPARCVVRTLIAVAGLAAVFATHADERTLYKSILPNGRVVYGDAPAANARRTEKITVERHAPNPQDAEAAQRALTLTREQLLQDAAARAARGKQLDNEIADAYSELKDAESRRERGREVQQGDRQGRRLSIRYLERQRTLDGAVQQARRRLDRLVLERAAL